MCRTPHPRTVLVRLVRRPSGRIGWPERLPGQGGDLPREADAAAGAPQRGNEKNKRLGSRTPPTGKGLYVCRGGDCLARLLDEKRFKRMFADAMEEMCTARLRAMLAAEA